MKFLLQDRVRYKLTHKPFPRAYRGTGEEIENWYIDFETLDDFIEFTINFDSRVVENEEVSLNYDIFWELPTIIFTFKSIYTE